MRRFAFIAFGVAAVIMVAAGPSAAKGEHPHARVTVSGDGLPGGAITLGGGEGGGDGGAFALGSGLMERKWDAPNIGGSLEPNAELGPAYVVRVALDCEPGDRARYRQTLYPNAPGGPQLFTPEGIVVCGATAPAGYDPLGPTLAALLRSHGVEFHPLALETAVRTRLPTPDAGSNAALAIAASAIGGLLIAVSIAGVEMRRRRRRAPV